MQHKHSKNTSAWYVSPKGRDTCPGTRREPFASLGRARDAVRAARENGNTADLRVIFRGGTYRFDTPVAFGLKDSAPAGAATCYEAAAGETPVFSGGIPVTAWEKAPLPPHAPPAAAGRIWRAPIPEGAGDCLTLYDGDRRLARARTPGFIPTDPAPQDRTGCQDELLHYPEGALGDWDLTEAELVIRNACPWSMNILPVKAIDRRNRELRVARPGTYSLTRLAWGADDQPTAWLENVAAGLDRPGVWYVNRREGFIYYWPPSGRPSRRIVIPSGVEMLCIEGQIASDGPVDTPVRGLQFKGITFSHGDRYAFAGKTGLGLQHDWDVYDAATAMVRLRGAEDCVFENCRFRNAGGTGIRLDLHAQDNHVVNCEFNRLGACGIVLAGYGQGLKDVNRNNRIENCLIEQIGELYRHAPAIFIWQSGWNRVVHNHLRDLPYSGIVVSTRGSCFGDELTRESRRTVREPERDYLLGDSPEAMLRVLESRGGGQGTRAESHDSLHIWEIREPLLHARHNTIERNLIESFTRVMFDGNGIYISGTGRGNIVRENWVRDFHSNAVEGIRCDDDQHDTLIESNLVTRFSNNGASGACSGIVSKGVTHIVNNIIAFPAGRMERGMISLELGPVAGSRIERNILYAEDPAHRPFYQDTYYKNGIVPRLRDCRVDRNLYFNSADPQWAEAHLEQERRYGIETRSRNADPCFVDPEADDYRLRPESPAHQMGFVPVRLDLIGRLRQGTC